MISVQLLEHWSTMTSEEILIEGIIFFSLKQSPIICIPIGSPLESCPHGTEIPGSPARLTEIV